MPSSLRHIRLFSNLSETTLAQAAKSAISRAFSAGQVIFLEGDPSSGACFIESGELKVYRLSASGREQTLRRLSDGDAFNLASVFQSSGGNHANAQALSAVQLHIIPPQDFRRLCQTCPDLAMAMLADLANRLEHLTNLVETLSLHTVRSRLARFLLSQADSTGLSQGWTQDEIAAHLGTVRDMVGRTLREFADAGLVRIERQRIKLLDRAGLEAETQI
ncbi:MAG: Crp/Fnr family transcriptional regulator [Anaerolineaceae bacterium]|nr:Crp/Fnr family transcriptional regulator [Anaerolineaceae bacterium]